MITRNNIPKIWLLAALLSGCSTIQQPPGEDSSLPVPKVTLPQAKPDITLSAVGDIMLGTTYPDDRRAPDDGKGLLAAVAPILKRSDITFGNLEGTLLSEGEPAKQCSVPSRCYVFRSPPHYVDYLKEAGFDVMSLANNHARDFGEEGRTASMEALDKAGIHHSGRLGDVASWQVKQSRVALIAFAPFRGSHDLLDIPLAEQLVQALAKSHDIVLVSMHAGAEGDEYARLPFQAEVFHGEQRGDVVKFARAMIDAGADLVLGHGPHVPRAIELYKQRLIAYSLGNFCTFLGIKISGANGIAPILNVKLTADGKFLEGAVISAQQTRPAGTILDSKHRAANMIAALTKADFATTPLAFTVQGQISITTHTALNDAQVSAK